MKRMRTGIVALSLACASFVAGSVRADVASLESALQHLQAARVDLEKSGKKDSHAKQALNEVGEAIDQVRKGIDEEQKKQQKDARKDEKKQESATKQQQSAQEKAAKDAQKAMDKAATQEQNKN